MRRPPGIYKRGKYYSITYMLKGRQCFESTHSSDIQVAINKLRERKAEIAEDRIVVSPSQAPMLSELIGLYIEQIEKSSTKKRYELAKRVLLRYLGDHRIGELTPNQFDRFKSERRKAGVTPRGVNRELAVARAALNFAVERRLIGHSSFDGVKLFSEDRLPPRSLSFPDEARLLARCDDRLRTLVTLLLETGMRVGIEALSLKWSEVDFDEGTIRVLQSKTSAGRRTLPMTPHCRAVLLAWQATTNGASKYVFFNPQIPDKHILSVKTAWHNALRTAGLEPLPIYNCRHTFATRLLSTGVPDAFVDQLLGHAQKSILSYYAGNVPDYLRDAVNRLDKLRISRCSPQGMSGRVIAPSYVISKGSNLVQ